MKRCSGPCLRMLSIVAFPPNGAGDVRALCRRCYNVARNIRRRSRYALDASHREAVLTVHAAWYASNAGRERSKQWARDEAKRALAA